MSCYLVAWLIRIRQQCQDIPQILEGTDGFVFGLRNMPLSEPKTIEVIMDTLSNSFVLDMKGHFENPV